MSESYLPVHCIKGSSQGFQNSPFKTRFCFISTYANYTASFLKICLDDPGLENYSFTKLIKEKLKAYLSKI